jgi:enterochelin esterase-like enzyme
MRRLFLPLVFCVCAPSVALAQSGDPALRPSKMAISIPVEQRTAIPRGILTRHAYITSIGLHLPGNVEEYYVYTPPGYDAEDSTKYPILFLLHGFDQNALGWQRFGKVQSTLDELISRGEARPMIVVMPNGYGDYKFLLAGKPVWLLPRKIDENVDLFAQMLLREIIPQVTSTYKISKRQEDHAIAGLSMGGREAITIGLENPHKFAWIGAFSAAFPDLERYRVPSFSNDPANFRLLWMACGVGDGFVFKGNMRVIADLTQRNLPVTTVVTHGVHDWPVWRNDLRRFLPLLFQAQ